MNSRIVWFAGMILPLAAIAQVPRAASSSTRYRVAPADACIDQFFDDSGSLNLHNHCTYFVTVLAFFGSAPEGSRWDLGAGQGFSSGYTSDDIEHRGPVQLYVCPTAHPNVRGLNGERIAVPGKPYLCE